ncbi:hypothetical protein PCE1_003448 [Barthelona sp. PCE]
MSETVDKILLLQQLKEKRRLRESLIAGRASILPSTPVKAKYRKKLSIFDVESTEKQEIAEYQFMGVQTDFDLPSTRVYESLKRSTAVLRQENVRLSAELEKMTEMIQQVENLKTQLSEQYNVNARLCEDIDELENDKLEVENTYSKAQSELATLRSKMAALTTELTSLRTESAARAEEDEFEQRIAEEQAKEYERMQISIKKLTSERDEYKEDLLQAENALRMVEAKETSNMSTQFGAKVESSGIQHDAMETFNIAQNPLYYLQPTSPTREPPLAAAETPVLEEEWTEIDVWMSSFNCQIEDGFALPSDEYFDTESCPDRYLSFNVS